MLDLNSKTMNILKAHNYSKVINILIYQTHY